MSDLLHPPPRPGAEFRSQARQAVAAAVPRWAVVGIFLLLSLFAIAYARAFLMPVVLAFLLALVFSPVRRFLEHHGVRPGFSAVLIVGLLLAVLVAGLLTLAVPATAWIQEAPQLGERLEARVRYLLGSVASVIEAGERMAEIATPSEDDAVQEVVVRESGLAAALATVAPAIIAQAVLTLVLLFFLLASGDMFYEKLVHVLPTLGDKRRAIRIARDIERKLSRYFFTITLINAALGVAVATAMWLIGMPSPALFGVIAFALNFIPYLGAVAGVVLVTIVGLVSLPEIGQALLAGAAYFTLTTIEGQFVTPHLVGRRLELNTVVVFLSVALWAWLWSSVGMLVAVPLLVTIHAFCEHIPQLEALGHFLSARGAELGGEEEPVAKT